MVESQDLTKHFNGFVAVEGVDLRVDSGEVLALLGPNGAGKTTTVRMLTSVLSPTRGRASIAGYDVIDEAPQVRASVGVLTENHGLYNRMPAGEYLDFYGQIYGLDHKNRQARIDTLLGMFGLLDAVDKRIGEYSKGMRQKLALARALIHEPPVLLLDEPTSAMDPESARLVRDSIIELQSSERAVIICTHNLAEAELLADRIAIIRNGRIIANGSPVELKNTFLGPPEYEAQFSIEHGQPEFEPPTDFEITQISSTHIRFRSARGGAQNHQILSRMLTAGFQVEILEEIPRTLEQVYLKAMTRENGNDQN